jgi:predicted nucleotidyltransferase
MGMVFRVNDMTALETKVLDEAATRLIKGLNPQKIYLFGSRANGTDSADSDYDIITIVSESDMPGYKRAMHARRLLSGLDASFDVIVMTINEWARQVRSGVSLPNRVLLEGRLLHDSGA